MSNQVSDNFRTHGGSYLLSNNAYEDYVQGKDMIGRPDGQFMIPSNQMDELVKNNPDNPREWEKQLGLEDGSLGNTKVRRVDVYNPQDYEPRLPTSDLSGSNDKFLEGQGKVPGGQDECVINQFPNPEKHPEVGKISTVYSEKKQSQSNNSDSKIKSKTDKVADGGGSRAPNVENVDTTPKTTKRGSKPSKEYNPSSKKETSEYGHKPVENEIYNKNESVLRGNKSNSSEETSEKADTVQKQRVNSSNLDDGESKKAVTASSDNSGDKASSNANSAKNETTKAASDNSAENTAAKPKDVISGDDKPDKKDISSDKNPKADSENPIKKAPNDLKM